MSVRAVPNISQPNVEELLGIKADIIDRHIILSGALDKELKEIQVLKDDLKIRQGIIDTIAKADKIRSDAEDYSQRVIAEANVKADEAKSLMVSSNLRLNEAIKKENFILNELATQQNKLKNDIVLFEKGVKDSELEFKKRKDEFDFTVKSKEDLFLSRELKLQQEREQFNKEKLVFADEKAAFQSKIDAIMKP